MVNARLRHGLIVGSLVLCLALLPCSQARATYDCGTYSAGDYGSENECVTSPTADSSSSSNSSKTVQSTETPADTSDATTTTPTDTATPKVTTKPPKNDSPSGSEATPEAVDPAPNYTLWAFGGMGSLGFLILLFLIIRKRLL